MWLTEIEAAQQLRVDKRTIRKAILAGRLKASPNLGTDRRHVYRIHQDDLRVFQPQATVAPTPPASRNEAI